MNREQFLQKIEENSKNAINLIKIKNKDYCGDDPFRSFKGAEFIGLSVEEGMLITIMNKLARVSNLLKNRREVKDETINDTLLDIQNYINILNVYIGDKKND